MGPSCYSEQAGMQWKSSSSVTANILKVCQYDWWLWHLFSLLHEASTLPSCFWTEPWMGTPTVTCRDDCICYSRQNLEHLSRRMILEQNNATPHGVHWTQRVVAFIHSTGEWKIIQPKVQTLPFGLSLFWANNETLWRFHIYRNKNTEAWFLPWRNWKNRAKMRQMHPCAVGLW